MEEQTEDSHDSALDEQLTQLVGYLDGELDVTQMTKVEHGLVNDSAMRSHADVLSKTWALLDELDDVPVSETFTQQTMATIATQAVENQTPGRPNGIFTSIATAVARYKVLSAFLIGWLGGSIGLFVANKIQEQRLQRKGGTHAVDQLIIENIDMLPSAGLYEAVPDVATLKSLKLVPPPETGASQ